MTCTIGDESNGVSTWDEGNGDIGGEGNGVESTGLEAIGDEDGKHNSIGTVGASNIIIGGDIDKLTEESVAILYAILILESFLGCF
jgi:hypothetical protein